MQPVFASNLPAPPSNSSKHYHGLQQQNSNCGRDGRVLRRRAVHRRRPRDGPLSPLQLHALPAPPQITVFPWLLPLLLFLPLVLVVTSVEAELPPEIPVGGVFDDILEDDGDIFDEGAFLHAVDRVNDQDLLPPGTKLVARVERVPYQDSFHAEKKVCSLLQEQVTALFGPRSPSSANHVQALCDTFFLPHVETTWDFRTSRGSFMVNLHPHPDVLSKAYADLITAWGWEKYILVYDTYESLVRLKHILHQSHIFNGRHVRVKQLPQDSNDYKPLFKEIRNSAGNSAIIIDCESAKLPGIFKDARDTGMVKDRRYFVTSLDLRILKPEDFDPAEGVNITAFSVVDPEKAEVQEVVREWAAREEVPPLPNNIMKTETALMYDGVGLLARALASLDASQLPDHNRKFQTSSINCHNRDDKWPDGRILLDALRNLQFEGLTGHVELHPETGFRTNFQLDVIEMTKTGFSRIGFYDTAPDLEEEKRFTWTRTAEETLRQQEADLKDKVLVVTTIVGAPYAMRDGDGNFTGYVPDMMEKLAGLLEFQYVIQEVADGKYGSPDNETGQWNGMIGEVMSGAADMAAADLSISFSRQSAVDFTMPFMNLGISILYKTPAKDPPALFSFLEPFNPEVWIYVLTAYLCMSFFLFMLARFSPRDWQEPPPCSPSSGKIVENPFSMANCLWFSTGTIMGQGCDILPAAICTRTATIAWWFFVLIMISSYTANLAAFLANEGMGSSIKDVKDLPSQHKVKYGCVKGGTTCRFFEKNNFPLYKEIWIAMMSTRPEPFAETTPGGVDRVKKANGTFAFFMESTSLEYAMANDPECRLTQIGGLLDSKGYGIALRKNSQYRNAFSNAILMLAEKGELETLKKKWWAGTGACENTEPPPGGATALSLANVGGVFVVLVGGVVMSVIMSLLEFIWKSRKLAKNVKENFWRAVWQDFKFAVFCQGETKQVRKSPEEEEDSSSSEKGSVPGSLPYLAFNGQQKLSSGEKTCPM